MASASDSSYRRALTPHEEFMHVHNRRGQCMISYLLGLASDKQLNEQQVREAVTAMHRKTPNLRLCIDSKDDQFWFKEMEEEKVDFQVLPCADPYAVFHEMARLKMDPNKGPLWAVRFIAGELEQTSMGDQEPKKSRLSFSCHIVVSFYHAITDGSSGLQFTQAFLSVLNDVVGEQEIHSSKQIGILIDVKKEEKLKNEIEQKFQINPKLLEERKRFYGACLPETLLEKLYPVPKGDEKKTIALTRVVEKELTEKFRRKSKSEGVTFHSAFCSLINAAIVQIISEGGGKEERYEIKSFHCVDERQYHSGADNELGLGMHVMLTIPDVPKDIMKYFWNEARKYNQMIRSGVENKEGVEREVVVSKLRSERGALPKDMVYYTTTNMRDVTSMLGQIDKHVWLQEFERLTDMSALPSLWIHSLHTLHGSLIHSLQYNIHLMQSAIAEKIIDRIGQLMDQVC